MGVKLIYKDVALGADEDAEVTATPGESFSDIAKIPFGVDSSAVATCEPNGWGLTKEYGVFADQPFAFWSDKRSGADCSFDDPPSIVLEFSEQYTSTGLTVRFSPDTMDYAAQMRVVWYQGGAVKHSGTFYPDSPTYVVTATAEAFDKLEFVFEKTNLPGKRLKVEQIIVGVIREFDGDELTNAEFLHEISPISDTVPVNVLDATFHSKDNIDFVFQRKQPVEGYNGKDLVGVYYIETGKRTGANDYSIACCDIVGVWDIEEYAGGIWITDTPLADILADVFGDVSLYFDIAPEYADSTLRGFIEPGTKRMALQQIAFALGAVVDTTASRKVRLYPFPVGDGATIPAAKTYTGGTVDMADKVTEVTVTAYVIFDERPDTNDEYVELDGVQYRYYTETKHAYNPDVVATDLQNKVKFTDAYLVNLSNAQTLADKILAYYMRRERYSFKHVLDGQGLGDRVSVSLPWGGETSGNITKTKISVTGITVSDAEMLLD